MLKPIVNSYRLIRWKIRASGVRRATHISTNTGRVAELRSVHLPPDPASRTAYVAGEIAQDDYTAQGVKVICRRQRF